MPDTRDRSPDDDDRAEADEYRPRPTALRRRRLLAISGAAATGALAGCGGGGDGSTATPTASSATTTEPAPDTTTATQTPTPSATAEPTTSTATTSEPTTTTAELTDQRQVLTAPSTHHHPLDGFSSADWLVEEDPEIVTVTSLDREGPGTLRDALRTPGPRIVVFEVGGVIDLQNSELGIPTREDTLLDRDFSKVLVAGQTAPPPGITLVRGELQPYARDTIIQHIRVRVGDEVDGDYDSFSGGSLSENLILDHCTATWSIDENMSADGGATVAGKTFSNNLIAEGLYDSVHSKGPHSKGSLLEENQTNVSIFGNLYSCHNARHPRFKGGVHGVFVNNLVYNFGVAVELGLEGDTPTKIGVVGNHFIADEATDTGTPVVWKEGGEHTPRAYVEDTVYPDDMALVSNAVKRVDESPLWPAALSPIPAEDLPGSVLPNAGARPAERPQTDKRIVRDVRERTGELIDTQASVGGYPDPEPTERALDPPEYGPAFAAWLRQHTRAVELGESPPTGG
ncbi:MAG: pectate lyase [Halobacteriaceae archaeon]